MNEILRAKELFLAAYELAEQRRRAFLDEHCSGELRPMVERLLLQAAGDDEAASRPPPQLADYVLLEELGHGGMGVVWLAEQKSLGRQVALKLLRPGLADAAMLKRFRREAAILARLQHPGIAQIHDVGTAENEQPFFAMEYVEGVPLDEFARLRQLDRDARLELVATVAEAVAHAHGKGVNSFAGPHAAGVAALVLSVAPELPAWKVKAVLEATCKDLGAEGRDVVFGAGLLQADRAVEAARQ